MLINEVASQPAFQKFWQKNSILGKLFPIPDGQDTSSAQSLAGLQTKKEVGSLVQQKLGKTASGNSSSYTSDNTQQYFQQKVQQGKSEMDILKNKIAQLGSGGGGSDMVMPDFKPNNQKTKTFAKRLELGFNIQNTPSSTIVPATSNIAVMVGYKANDKNNNWIWDSLFTWMRFACKKYTFQQSRGLG